MPTVSASLKMFDMMTSPLQQVTQALNLTIGAMDNLSNSANRDIKITNSLNAAREAIHRADAGLQELANEQNRAANNQERLNNSFNRGASASDGLLHRVRGLVGAYLGFQTLKTGIDATDNYTNQSSRLALINDGLQTQEQLQQKIYQAAQRSRGAYGETVSSVAKLGLLAKDAFSNNNETIAFAELMNKSFKISGASASEASNGMYQLTQAMASGRLQGDEFRSVMENAPMLAQAIAKYTGKSMGELREMSSEGEITANIIKNSLFSAANDINAKFATMPMTFGTVWTSIKNKAVMEFSTIMEKVNGFINSSNGSIFINDITNSIVILSGVIGWVIDGIISVSTFFNNNWGTIEPIIWGIIAALIVYNTVSLITNTIIATQAFLESKRAAASMLATGKTFAQTAAQHGLNAALAACPITWIILGIILLIAVFYAAVAAVNHFAGTSISATGLICGAFMTALAFIGNLFVAAFNLIIDGVGVVWNGIATFAEFFANVFTDPIGSVIRLFSGMADAVLGILNGIASAIDSVFGSNLAGAVGNWQSGLQGKVDSLVGEAKIKVPRMDSSSVHLQRFDYGKAYNTGNNFGKSLEEKFDISKILGGVPKDVSDIGNFSNLGNFGKGSGSGGLDDDSKKRLKNIDDKIDISNEHLEMLRDLAEMESVQNFVTLTPTVQVTTGDIKEEADINKIIAKIETYMENELVNSAEGVYA